MYLIISNIKIRLNPRRLRRLRSKLLLRHPPDS